MLAELHGNSNLELFHDRATNRKCTKCRSILSDSIINFGESLPKHELETSFDHAKRADVCLVLGSSLRVTPAAPNRQIVGQQGGKLAIGNLQSTLLASLAKLNIHTMCDDLMEKLIRK
ncbi:hypothetical protein I4U23_014852 [Adineta vaga]|nr:hypothetical protein I4U23_014852 [Adineta vaga]